jgi:hypothetical protein
LFQEGSSPVKRGIRLFLQTKRSQPFTGVIFGNKGPFQVGKRSFPVGNKSFPVKKGVMFGRRGSFQELLSFSILYSVFWPTVWHHDCLQILADRESKVSCKKENDDKVEKLGCARDIGGKNITFHINVFQT